MDLRAVKPTALVLALILCCQTCYSVRTLRGRQLVHKLSEVALVSSVASGYCVTAQPEEGNVVLAPCYDFEPRQAQVMTVEPVGGIASSWVQIKEMSSDRCWALGADHALKTADCNPDDDTQLFRIMATETGEYRMLLSDMSHCESDSIVDCNPLCVNVPNPGNRQGLRLAECSASASQKFKVDVKGYTMLEQDY